MTLLESCDNNKKELNVALKLARSHKTELVRVLKHYHNEPQKLKAAIYLIQNMPYHFSIDEFFLSPSGEKYRPDISF